MKITKTNEEVTGYRKTVFYNLTVENSKGEEMDIMYEYFISDDDISGYETDEKFYDENENDISFENTLNDFLGDDYDDFIDELAEIRK